MVLVNPCTGARTGAAEQAAHALGGVAARDIEARRREEPGQLLQGLSENMVNKHGFKHF